MTGPELLDTAAVRARYGLRDPRAARKLMDEAGAFVVGRRLLVRLDDLIAHEDALRAARLGNNARGVSGAPPTRHPTARPRRVPRPARAPLRPGWWRASGDDPADGSDLRQGRIG